MITRDMISVDATGVGVGIDRTIVVHAILHLLETQHIPQRVADSSYHDIVASIKKDCREQIFRKLYGDLHRRLVGLEYAIAWMEHSVDPGGRHDVLNSFQAILKDLQ